MTENESCTAGRIDVHSHMFPKEYAKALNSVKMQTLGFPIPDWSVENLLEMMEGCGIETTIVSTTSPAANVGDVKAGRDIARMCNDISAQMIKDYPGKLGAFATLPLPDVEGSLSEIEYALGTLKLDGVGLLTNYNLTYLGDGKFEEVFRALNRYKSVVHVHPGDPPGHQFDVPSAFMDAPFDTTRAIANLICNGTTERYPDISFIFSHGGGTMPYLAFRIGGAASSMWKGFRENVPKGFNHYLTRMYYDTALVGANALPCIKALVGTSQMIFSTDYPFPPLPIIQKLIKEYENHDGFDAAERKAVERDNALKLFPRFARKSDKPGEHK
jgi:6-methylsalicylate decarboxylase